MKSDPLSPSRLLRALELFGPQARPYNFDDHFDCWGLVQRVFDWVDDGFDMNQEALDETTVGNWQDIGRREELVPGDLLATHPQPDPEYHVVFYCGRVGGHDLVYDSSPRGSIPVFDRCGGLLAEREVFTRYSRATETTDRLRDDGGAYLRLWHDGMCYFHKGLPARLVADGAAEERDLVAPRRAAPSASTTSRSTAAGVFRATRSGASSTTTCSRAISTTTCPTARPFPTTCTRR